MIRPVRSSHRRRAAGTVPSVAATPSSLGFAMPPECWPHTRTWMSYPPLGTYLRADGRPVGEAWAAVANAVVKFEPVTMLVPPEAASEAGRLLDPRIAQVPCPLDDAWFRDSGPTFLLGPSGELGAVRWRFNAWGHDGDPPVAQDIAAGDRASAQTGASVFASRLVNEGGAICVDGEGTVLATESVQLHDRRNPGWTREEVEGELCAMLGCTKVIWLATGLTGDMQGYGTHGHVDLLAAFVAPGLVVVHHQPDPQHPDHEVMVENVGRLRGSTDARGRQLQLVEVDAPTNRWEGGVPLDCSYVNFSFVNGGAVLCGFNDPPADEAAAETFARLLPGRRLEVVPALDIFRYGGGVHCITQQEPAPPTGRPAPA